MALTSVKMAEEVWLACLTHALTTETEEIMGLLLGDIRHDADGSAEALIWGASPQVRSDRRKDRVETNPEQLAAATAQAERMTQRTGRTTRVIGWYHSHPHITVLPSHVDVRTQAMYQMLDSGFLGLIFSCFNEDSQKVGKIQVIAFQSLNRGRQLSSLITKSSANERALLDKDSGNSIVAKEDFSREINSSGIDFSDMAASMQEALHLSNMDARGAEYIRKEIPLQVLPNWSVFKFDSPLSSFAAVQRVLFEEEKSAYNEALLLNTRNGSMHPLAFIHHTSAYQASLCKLMEHCLVPAVNVLQDRLKENKIQLAVLEEEAKCLELEVHSRESSSKVSDRRGGWRDLLNRSPHG